MTERKQGRFDAAGTITGVDRREDEFTVTDRTVLGGVHVATFDEVIALVTSLRGDPTDANVRKTLERDQAEIDGHGRSYPGSFTSEDDLIITRIGDAEIGDRYLVESERRARLDDLAVEGSLLRAVQRHEIALELPDRGGDRFSVNMDGVASRVLDLLPEVSGDSLVTKLMARDEYGPIRTNIPIGTIDGFTIEASLRGVERPRGTEQPLQRDGNTLLGNRERQGRKSSATPAELVFSVVDRSAQVARPVIGPARQQTMADVASRLVGALRQPSPR